VKCGRQLQEQNVGKPIRKYLEDPSNPLAPKGYTEGEKLVMFDYEAPGVTAGMKKKKGRTSHMFGSTKNFRTQISKATLANSK
jgi:hypothetical protein